MPGITSSQHMQLFSTKPEAKTDISPTTLALGHQSTSPSKFVEEKYPKPKKRKVFLYIKIANS